MGKAKKSLESFIDEIPDSKLTDLGTRPGTIYTDSNFRFDMQGVRNQTDPAERMLEAS